MRTQRDAAHPQRQAADGRTDPCMHADEAGTAIALKGMHVAENDGSPRANTDLYYY